MNTLNTRISKALVLSALLCGASLAQAAGTATRNIGVSANISPKCTISTTPVAFGEYDPITGSDVTTAGTIVVGCTKASPNLWVGLGGGTNGTLAQRKMKHATLSDTLNYSLMQPMVVTPGAACPAMDAGTEWTDTKATALNLESPTSYDTRTYNVCGQLRTAQDSSVGAYADTVLATINF